MQINPLAARSRIRPAAIIVHRWVGLAMALFLTTAGLTGSMLAFYRELDAWLNPELFHVVPPAPGAPLLDPFELRERIRSQLRPGVEIDGLMLRLEPESSVNYWIEERETFADPYTGQVLGSRSFGDLGEGRKNLLTFIYRFHYSLALGDVGTVLFGIVALLWTIDCFVGAYLTLPSRAQRSDGARKPWVRRWLPAWMLKTNTLFTLVFTWHRASGLWVWAFLLVFAWSGVALNLGDEVYKPVMGVLVPGGHDEEHSHLPQPRTHPKLDARAALERGRSAIAAEARRAGFDIMSEQWLWYEAEHGTYTYAVESTHDVSERLADTTVEIDGDDGRVVAVRHPLRSARSAIDQWLIALHFGSVREGGMAYRAFVSFLGLLVALLSVTGVWIWLRKRTKKPIR